MSFVPAFAPTKSWRRSLTLMLAIGLVVSACAGSTTTEASDAPTTTEAATTTEAETTTTAAETTTTTEAETATTEAAEPGGAGASLDGQVLFESNCSRCHGVDGSGGRGPDIRDVTDTALVIEIATNGRRGMPSFGQDLTPEEISAIADWVVTGL